VAENSAIGSLSIALSCNTLTVAPSFAVMLVARTAKHTAPGGGFESQISCGPSPSQIPLTGGNAHGTMPLLTLNGYNILDVSSPAASGLPPGLGGTLRCEQPAYPLSFSRGSRLFLYLWQ